MEKQIWIVDDDEGILDVTKIVLDEAGFNVRAIQSAIELKEQLKGELPCAILLDVSISGANGVAVSKEIKTQDRTKGITVILMSANPDLEEKTKEALADSFLKKPYDIAALEAKVREYCN